MKAESCLASLGIHAVEVLVRDARHGQRKLQLPHVDRDLEDGRGVRGKVPIAEDFPRTSGVDLPQQRGTRDQQKTGTQEMVQARVTRTLFRQVTKPSLRRHR